MYSFRGVRGAVTSPVIEEFNDAVPFYEANTQIPEDATDTNKSSNDGTNVTIATGGIHMFPRSSIKPIIHFQGEQGASKFEDRATVGLINKYDLNLEGLKGFLDNFKR